MSPSALALVVAVGLLGPLLSARSIWRVPVVVGEIVGGILIGQTGFRLIDPQADGLRLLADIGFGLTMVVVGSQIPVRDHRFHTRTGLLGLAGAAIAGVVAAALGTGLATLFGTGHALVYGIVLASSSAAIVLPMLTSLGYDLGMLGQLVTQIAVADIVCVVALPFAVAPWRAGSAAVGALIIAAVSVGLVLVLRRVGRSGLRRRAHAYSERRRFALELRLSLLVLFTFAAIAQFAQLSIMLAGFALGLVLSAVGEPHRLARQLFGMTEGFFGPLFFVWLGASIDLRELVAHPSMIMLGLALGVSALIAHAASRIAGLPWSQAIVSGGQLGVPVAAVALGLQVGGLRPGEGSAILLGALLTVAAAALLVGRIPGRSERRFELQ
ncbi:cation:proton antiporter [Leifsonia shinshuensis]|uniref:cation:proton antiporter n=1 Tax=Leifsonia shinshuensis TaxID=150026 RepID=UPI00285CE161|nr:cation:proton antiporter [Leifsonia shinshuensis]MDR6970760.1 Kef-type K+ transport system membrane component KefB [Leifsonia shinshuensis]